MKTQPVMTPAEDLKAGDVVEFGKWKMLAEGGRGFVPKGRWVVLRDAFNNYLYTTSTTLRSKTKFDKGENVSGIYTYAGHHEISPNKGTLVKVVGHVDFQPGPRPPWG